MKALKIVTFTRKRESENWQQTDVFFAEQKVKDVEGAIREAVNEFLYTEEGKRMIKQTSEDFNWGDALNSMKESDWSNFGIYPKDDDKEYLVKGETVDIFVDQDEILIKDEHFEDEEQEVE